MTAGWACYAAMHLLWAIFAWRRGKRAFPHNTKAINFICFLTNLIVAPLAMIIAAVIERD